MIPPANSWRWHWLAVATLTLAALLRWHARLLYPEPAIDEVAYLQAFARSAAGLDPYQVERFIYPPTFAATGGAALAAWGQETVVALLRGLNLLGACALVWVSLAMTSWRRGVQLALGIALVTAWAPIDLSFDAGNVSPLVIGVTLAALALVPRRPIAAGLGLACGLLSKPLALPAVLLLFGWRQHSSRSPAQSPDESDESPDRPRRRAAVAAATALAAAAVATLACGPAALLAMLAKTAAPPTPGHTLSLWRLLYCCGLNVPPGWLLLGITGLVSLWEWRRPLSVRQFTVLAATASIYVLPLVWTHTLALTLPAQLLAFEHAIKELRATRAGGGAPYRRAILTLAVLTALAASIQWSHALVSINDRPLPLQALMLLPPVLGPAIFAAYGLATRRR